LCLPAVMRFNLEAAAPHYARLARLFDEVGHGTTEKGTTEKEAAAKSIGEVEGMIDRLGITRGLRNHGIPRESLEGLSTSAFDDSCHKTNIRPCTLRDLLALYEESWKA
jgi:alcohol dehydrogenase class IV